MILVCRSLGGNDRNDKQKARVKSSEKSLNSEQKRSPSLKDSPEGSETKLLWRISAVQSCKSLASSSNHDFAWQSGVTRCDSKAEKFSVFLLLNMHIIISSWQMLHFQCLIIRFYRFSLILPKRKNNYMSPHFMPLSVWNFWQRGALLRLLKFVVSVHCNLQYTAFLARSCNCLSLFLCETNLTARHVWPKEITEICCKVWRNCHKSWPVVNYKEFWAVSQIATAFFFFVTKCDRYLKAQSEWLSQIASFQRTHC